MASTKSMKIVAYLKNRGLRIKDSLLFEETVLLKDHIGFGISLSEIILQQCSKISEITHTSYLNWLFHFCLQDDKAATWTGEVCEE